MTRRLLIISANQRGGWGGSEKFWYESLLVGEIQKVFECHVALRTTEVNQIRKQRLSEVGVDTKLFDVDQRYTIRERIKNRMLGPHSIRRKCWMSKAISLNEPSLVWFNIGGFRRVCDVFSGSDYCRKNGIPYFIVFQHGDELWIPSEPLMDETLTVLTSAAGILFVSERNLRAMERALGARLSNAHLVQNSLSNEAVESAAVLPPVGETPGLSELKMVHFGRLEPSQKGQDIVLECLGHPEWKQRNWSLDFHGEGYARPLLNRWIGYFGVDEKRIRVLNHSDNIWNTLSNYNLLVLPSRSEGSPYALLECMAAGRPAVATSVAGIPEVIDHKKNGWLASESTADSFNIALNMAWQQRSSLQDYGEAARATILQSYTQQTACRELTSILGTF